MSEIKHTMPDVIYATDGFNGHWFPSQRDTYTQQSHGKLTSYTRTDIHETTKAELANTVKNYVDFVARTGYLKLELEQVKQSHAELLALLHNLTWIIPDAALEKMKTAIANAEKVKQYDPRN